MKLGIYDKNHRIRIETFAPEFELEDRPMIVEGKHEVHLGSRKISYQEGDYIKLEVDTPDTYLVVSLEDTFEPSLVYFKEVKEWIYEIPYTQAQKFAMKDTAFSGEGHYLKARIASDAEIYTYQNLARNRHASYQDLGIYPFAHANVETRNDPTFFARNAIDGIFANNDHGAYPFQSWGINQQEDAALTIEFGQEVRIDTLAFTLRCDFPHDTWWNQITVEFSDGTKEVFNTKKESARQVFEIEARNITWLKMCEMKKGEPGPFPALSQIEAFGTRIRKD